MSDPHQSLKLEEHMENFEQLLGVFLGYHDYLLQSGLPVERREHSCQACLTNKAKKMAVCLKYCGAGGQVDQNITQHPDGHIKNCPWGLPKISIPLMEGDELIGVLFGVVENPKQVNEDELDMKRKAMLLMRSHLHKEMGQKWSLRFKRNTNPRHTQILEFIESNLENDVSLGDLSQLLRLSDSHVSRWISDNFNQTFLQLMLDMRLERSALWLVRTDLSVAHIAQRLRFCDQSHFSHMFKRRYQESPLKYRKKRQL